MNFIYEIKVNKTFNEVIESIKESLKEHNFGVLWELNFKEKLKEKGFESNVNFKILEVCNPQKAKEVLETNIEVGYFLPCKIAIYEKNSDIFIGMVKPTTLINMINSKDLDIIANEVEQTLKQAIDDSIF